MDTPKASIPPALHGALANEQEERLALANGFIEGHPDSPLGWQALGFALLLAGRTSQAAPALQRALDLGSADLDVHEALGLALKSLGQLEAALETFQRLVAIKPDHPAGHNNLGNILLDLNRPEEALASYAKALELKPDSAQTHNNMGCILLSVGRLAKARESFARALAIAPDYAAAHNNLGTALKELGLFEEALASYLKALEINPDFPEPLSNLGTFLKDMGRMDSAFECWAKALKLRPDFVDAHSNMATAFCEQGRFAQAFECYAKALEHGPNNADIRTNYAMALLATGNFADGWREYEHRLRIGKRGRPKRRFAAPRWQGQDLSGKTLLIHAEQGFGDTMQFCRYAALAGQRGARVVLEVQAPVLRLLGSLAGVSELAVQGGPVPASDFHIPMLSLPGAFGARIDNIPYSEGYLGAGQADIEAWRRKLAHVPSSLKRVGLAWSGGLHEFSYDGLMTDKRRSIGPETLGPLFAAPDIYFVSLQKDGPKAPRHFPLFDPMADCQDFADTAGLIMNLDLVLSVDTAVAHLAGALGKPVWLLNRLDSCWRWQRESPSTPWYGSMRIFHQKSRGDWAGVLERVKDALGSFAPERPAT